MPSVGISTALKHNAPKPTLNDLGTEGLDTSYSDGGGFYSFASVTVTAKSNGEVSIALYNNFLSNTTVSWYPGAPITGIGQRYWCRFTRTSNGLTGEASSSASTGWLTLSSDRSIVVSVNDTDLLGDDQALCNYTLDIAAPGGFPIYETHNFVLEANSF